MKKVAIVLGPEVGNEYEAIRQCLEYFGLVVYLVKIGRPTILYRPEELVFFSIMASYNTL